MRVLIVGCSMVGARLATTLASEGHEVSVVDNNRRAFQRLGEEVTCQTVLGLGIDHEVLKSAGVESADVFVAVTDSNNANLVAAQIAKKKYRVPKVIARVYNPDLLEVFRDAGITLVCPTSVTVNHLLKEISGNGA